MVFSPFSSVSLLFIVCCHCGDELEDNSLAKAAIPTDPNFRSGWTFPNAPSSSGAAAAEAASERMKQGDEIVGIIWLILFLCLLLLYFFRVFFLCVRMGELNKDGDDLLQERTNDRRSTSIRSVWQREAISLKLCSLGELDLKATRRTNCSRSNNNINTIGFQSWAFGRSSILSVYRQRVRGGGREQFEFIRKDIHIDLVAFHMSVIAISCYLQWFWWRTM